MERDLARALVIGYALGNLVNSLLLDHTEGTLFCWASTALFAAYTATCRVSRDMNLSVIIITKNEQASISRESATRRPT